MANPFQQIITSDVTSNRIQANISNALNQASPISTITVNNVNFNLLQLPGLLSIPTTAINNASSGVKISLPDATKLGGQSFFFKKTDSSSNSISFFSAFKNQQNQTQTVENVANYSVSNGYASGKITSDGNNWWVTSSFGVPATHTLLTSSRTGLLTTTSGTPISLTAASNEYLIITADIYWASSGTGSITITDPTYGTLNSYAAPYYTAINLFPNQTITISYLSTPGYANHGLIYYMGMESIVI